ncbi:MAG: heat shock protein HspQ [Thermaurantiacus sp.]
MLAENDETAYVAYVSQQNLLPDDEKQPVRHLAVSQLFDSFHDGRYILRKGIGN